MEEFLVTFNQNMDQFQTSSQFAPVLKEQPVAPSTVEEYMKLANEILVEKKGSMDFARFKQLNEQFLILQTVSKVFKLEQDFEKMRKVSVTLRNTMFDFLQKSTVMDRPNEEVFMAAYGLVHSGFMRAEDYLAAIDLQFQKDAEGEHGEIIQLLAFNQMRFFIQLVLPFNRQCATQTLQIVMQRVPHIQQNELVELVNRSLNDFNNATNNATSKQTYHVVGFQNGFYQVVPVPGEYTHKPKRFSLRRTAIHLKAIDPLEFAQFFTHRVAFAMRDLTQFDLLCNVYQSAGVQVKNDKVAEVQKELLGIHNDVRSFVRSFIAYDDYMDLSLTWFLLFCKNLRELNNFQLLKTVAAALTEEAHPEIHRQIQTQMASIPERISLNDTIPVNSIRNQLVVPSAIPIRAERFVHPSMKTVVEDCLRSCGIKALNVKQINDIDSRPCGVFTGPLGKQAVKEGELVLSYRMLYGNSVDSQDAQMNYLSIMCASAPPVVYDLDFVLFFLKVQLKKYLNKLIMFDEYLQTQGRSVNLVMNLHHFTFNFDDHNDQVLDKLFRTLPRLSEEELQKATANNK
ncbi:Conserved_hypothetical protein [Hexamita inflata]|uniref:Uncharacterized protein n=1 Tax=Hexamita inflata TaxID=28002 RepID=A0AA86PNB3_9EUKA|nr:Conserved hypothetical protein [Hexamita inflata]